MNKEQAKYVHDRMHEVVQAKEKTSNPTFTEAELRAWVNYFMRAYNAKTKPFQADFIEQTEQHPKDEL